MELPHHSPHQKQNARLGAALLSPTGIRGSNSCASWNPDLTRTNRFLAGFSKSHAQVTYICTRPCCNWPAATTMVAAPSARCEGWCNPRSLARECAAVPRSFLSEARRGMTRKEFLEAALTKLAQAVKLLDSAGEELLADDALELTERVNFILSSLATTPVPSSQ